MTVERFAERYAGMLGEPTPRHLAQAVSAFNALDNSAAPSYLAAPPAGFVVALLFEGEHETFPRRQKRLFADPQ